MKYLILATLILTTLVFVAFTEVNGKPSKRHSRRTREESLPESKDETRKRETGAVADSDDGGREKRKAKLVPPPDSPADAPGSITIIRKPSNSTTRAPKITTIKPNLCPKGKKYLDECNNCFCDPKTGETQCTTYMCYQVPPPTTGPPSTPVTYVKEMLK